MWIKRVAEIYAGSHLSIQVGLGHSMPGKKIPESKERIKVRVEVS